MLTGWHDCVNKWRVFPEKDSFIDMKDVSRYLKTPTFLSHSDIGWINMDRPYLKYDKRYALCDYSFPGIVAENVENPYNKKYRMIDGSHRMAKMLRETDINESYFYIITCEQFYSLLKDRL
jgi:hypothetical protein